MDCQKKCKFFIPYTTYLLHLIPIFFHHLIRQTYGFTRPLVPADTGIQGKYIRQSFFCHDLFWGSLIQHSAGAHGYHPVLKSGCQIQIMKDHGYGFLLFLSLIHI